MNRLAACAAGAALLMVAGCLPIDVRKMLDGAPNFDSKSVPPATLAVAERVETLGRKIIAQNTFTGIEPQFMTVGVKESVLFHNGTEQLYISEGLVAKCKTDADLAAVLCAELGQMVAEKRTAKAVGRDVDPIKDASHGAPVLGGGTPVDPGREAELALREQRHPRGADALDAAKTARELLTGAGFGPADLDRVGPLLKQSDRGEKLRKQMSTPAPAPKWER